MNRGKNADVWVVVPAFDEATVIGDVIRRLRAHFDNVVCVDDGSSDATAAEARRAGAVVIRHPVNLGQGAALQTGFEFVLAAPNMRWVVTFDADGQHQVGDIIRMIQRAREGDVAAVFGSRFLGTRSEVGGLKSMVLRAAVVYTNVTTRTRLTDAHNGLRVLRRDVVERVEITQNRMAHASQLVSQLARLGLPMAECPVEVLYTDYSRRKGQSVWNAVNILTELWSR